MGIAKSEMMRLEELEMAATAVAIEAGALVVCELHDDIVLYASDQEAERMAYAIGTNRVKAGEVNGTREEFMAAIKEALEFAGTECALCAKYAEED